VDSGSNGQKKKVSFRFSHGLPKITKNKLITAKLLFVMHNANTNLFYVKDFKVENELEKLYNLLQSDVLVYSQQHIRLYTLELLSLLFQGH
jgi:hypothetical protein